MANLGRTIERSMFYGAGPKLFEYARELRKNSTEAEDYLWQRIRKKQIHGLNFRRQHPIDIFIVDFYCHEYKLIIEIDGSIHEIPEIAKYDIARTDELKRFDLNILRFSNDEVLNDPEKVINVITKTVNSLNSQDAYSDS